MSEKIIKRLAVLTSTRAEYGLLKTLIKKLIANKAFNVDILVTGTHLSNEYGHTCNEILEDGFSIAEKVDILTEDDGPKDISKRMACAITGFSSYFENKNPDALIVLGDRYETLAVCLGAMNFRIPIIHLHGGEITEGALDDSIRHSITKLSYLHFTSTDEYRNRVIQMGESPDRVFNVGALGVENVLNEELISIEELGQSLNYYLHRPYVVVTFHPVTLEGDEINQINQVLDAISRVSEFQYIITGANADSGGKAINRIIEQYADEKENVIFVQSLGVKRYLSALKNCLFVMGNSSSGIIEAPSFGVPTINIGDRQKGRIQADSVINCEVNADQIVDAMRKCALEKTEINNPYGKGNTSQNIVSIIEDYLLNSKIDLKKKFYDMEINR